MRESGKRDGSERRHRFRPPASETELQSFGRVMLATFLARRTLTQEERIALLLGHLWKLGFSMPVLRDAYNRLSDGEGMMQPIMPSIAEVLRQCRAVASEYG